VYDSFRKRLVSSLRTDILIKGGFLPLKRL
jgi:hypothetical protein